MRAEEKRQEARGKKKRKRKPKGRRGRVSGLAHTNPEPSVIYSPAGTISQKKLENPAGFWNNVGENRSSLFQNKGAFE
jgi:hypothetical protein